MQNCETMLDPGVEPVSTTVYEIADRRLSVEADVEWVTQLAERFLSGFHFSPSLEHDQRSVDLRLKIMTGPRPPLPTALQKFDVPGGVGYRNHQSYFLDVKGSRVAVGDSGSRQIGVWIGDTARARSRDSFITVMAYAVPAALRQIGLYDLHAAALVEPETGSCFLFPGSSGSGKTSLSLRLAASGWQYLSDDVVVLSEAEEGVEARGLRRAFQTSDDSLAGHELPRLDEALGVTIPNDSNKRRLDPDILFPGQFAESGRPVAICFPLIAGAWQSRVEEITKVEAMMRLILICPWSNHDSSAAREHLRVLGCLVQQSQTFSLHAGRDIFDNPTGASTLLAELVKEVR